MNQGPVEDRLAIRELVETFAVGTSRIDPELWGSTWAEDGSWKVPSMDEPVKGKANIVAAFNEKLAYVKLISMSSLPINLVVDGDRARGQTHCQELIFPKTGGQITYVGCFEDEYVKRDGRWYFQSRNYTVLGSEKVLTP